MDVEKAVIGMVSGLADNITNIGKYVALKETVLR